MPRRTIAVIGSLNIDFITRTSRIPEPGETLTASSFDTGFGGKGANQAVACARLAPKDVSVRMVGNVGGDIFGKDYFEGLKKEGINASGVRMLEGRKTGVSNIIVDEATGENRILFTANANYEFGGEGAGWDLVPEEAALVVMQMEVPLGVVLHNMHLARESGKHVILNPAPAQLLPDWAYQDIDTLIMNETETLLLAGHQSLPAEQLPDHFLGWGVKEAVIITLGGEGLVYATASGDAGRVSARKVKVVDTTAAGDTFVGAYAVKRAQHDGDPAGFDIKSALEFATAAAAKSVERVGAMAAIPYLSEV